MEEVWSFWGVEKLGFFSGVGWVWSFECEFVSYAWLFVGGVKGAWSLDVGVYSSALVK